ncbi:MAG: ABC transporter permease [Bacillota bacterium]
MRRITRIELKNALERLLIILGSVLAALLVAALFILPAGVNPMSAFAAMFRGAFGSISGIGDVLLKATPIILVGLGVCISLSGGHSNLGGDGQLIMGGLFSAMVGITFKGILPNALLYPMVIFTAVLAGGIWGGIAGFLKMRFGMSTIIVTIMLNYIAANLLTFFVEGPFKGADSYLPQTAPVPKAFELAKFMPGMRANFGFVVALTFAFIVYFLLKNTVVGYRIRALGQAPKAAAYAGVRSDRYAFWLMFVAGAFAGLAGMIEIYGVHFRVLDGIASGYGYLGISAALLAGNNPLALILSSAFFGALKVGANFMQVKMQIPASIVNITQGIIILFMMISPGIKALFAAKIDRIKLLRMKRQSV